MKYFFFLLLFVQTAAFAQSYTEQITNHRTAYKADFLKEERSPLKAADLSNLHFFDADSSYRVIAEVKILENEKVFKMPTYNGQSNDYIRYAQVEFNLNGKKLSMIIYRSIALMNNESYKNHLFLPFTDETNNKTTYGGGRYIDLDIKNIQNNRIEIDFNKAYNPYCAYSDGYRCPVPPEENDLQIAVNAGEKNYTGEKKHKK